MAANGYAERTVAQIATIDRGSVMRVIAIDFDGTIKSFVSKVNEFYEDKENFIVVYTARSSAIRQETEEELRLLGVRYHALVMDKIRADVYIDDRNAGGLSWVIE